MTTGQNASAGSHMPDGWELRPLGHGGPMIDINGAIDMHVHTYPCIFPRLLDDLQLAISARDAGLRAVLIKGHHESTVSRAYLASQAVPEVAVFGGLTLNSYVGFVNPLAAEAALALGGKSIWMPSIDSRHHVEQHGSSKLVGISPSISPRAIRPYSSLDEKGKLQDEVWELLEVIASYDAILSTSHSSPAEVYALVAGAKSKNVGKVVITHPFYKAPGLSLEQLQELVGMGAMAELNYADYTPMWQAGQHIEEAVEAIERLGAENCILVSDTGQTHNAPPSEALRQFSQGLLELGVAEEDIMLMIRDNPARMLGLST